MDFSEKYTVETVTPYDIEPRVKVRIASSNYFVELTLLPFKLPGL